MPFNPVLAIRMVQGVLAFIAMSLGATVANAINTETLGPPTTITTVPSSVVFYIFVAVFTMLITVPYTIICPRYFPLLANPFAMLAAETTTAIFWLGGFASIADHLRRHKIDFCGEGVDACAAARGSIAVGVLECILFFTTAWFAFSHIFLGGRFAAADESNLNQLQRAISTQGHNTNKTNTNTNKSAGNGNSSAQDHQVDPNDGHYDHNPCAREQVWGEVHGIEMV
ncbi:hypothetical protein HRR83_008109 [Exophiala dermatitidis]|uniref:MARVEL domain-containing protein n=1 Tax=Exophiala dermatitidis TaxID=5970 RepID=A0AAN6ERH5_EXODE|nr:hypothetical protein HRR75_008138 [Exophiala dermatitidis]KAJ4505031.1 hypothetical protein HRR74_008859 [Exophiala dermatitidis]KAJ4513539.1 hypothetical protein HRR73_005697 [Exophiala dermatitidis]KAJ4535683.1 hypothetical protein HRR77_007631 [Exophiala dermatitidis]KAJ4541799.1 hypothetical protein HRR78_007077 [Exophiala dermatitidis]